MCQLIQCFYYSYSMLHLQSIESNIHIQNAISVVELIYQIKNYVNQGLKRLSHLICHNGIWSPQNKQYTQCLSSTLIDK